MMKRVVLIDDDRDDAELFSEALEEIGSRYSFRHFENAMEAIGDLQHTSNPLPDIIFLDINLPTISGWEFLVQAKKINHLASIPVVMYTTSSQSKEKETAIELGAVAFITKPNNYNELKRLLNQVFRDILNVEITNSQSA